MSRRMRKRAAAGMESEIRTVLEPERDYDDVANADVAAFVEALAALVLDGPGVPGPGIHENAPLLMPSLSRSFSC